MNYTVLDFDTCKELAAKQIEIEDVNNDGFLDLNEFTNLMIKLSKDPDL